MKKTYILALCLLLLLPFITNSTAQAAEMNSGTIAIPVSKDLIGSDNSAKTFYLDLPSGVTSPAIKTGTFKYSGNNSVIGTITVENGKIKLTLKGNEKIDTFNVEGKDRTYSRNFKSTPGNSIWRYADGRRWQINDYNENLDVNKSYNVNAEDSATPSGVPPKRVVSTKSVAVDPGQATWFKNGVDTVPYSSVIQTSIQLIPLSLEDSPGKVSTNNGKFVITYTVPSSKYTPEEVSDSFGKGQWVEGRLYYVTLPYYFTAYAKVTSYSYAGTVTFDYNLPTEPTLTGSAVILKPNPNPTKFEDKDVTVQLSLKGDLAAYTDTSNISEWVFYAKEKGVDSTLQTKKEYSKVLSSRKEFNFTIPKSRITKDNVEQVYDLTVMVRFTKPVITSSGSITSLQKSFTSTVEVYKNNPSIVLPPGPSGPATQGKPPVAVLDIPNSVMAGEEFLISGGGSYDPDGTIVDYIWGTPNVVDPISGKNGYTWYTNSSLGEQPVSLRVIDNDNMSSATSGKISVVEPIPRAFLEVRGTKKENRKVTIHNKSTSPQHYPIDSTKTQMTISPVSGGTAADIKYSGSLSGISQKDVVFKKAGTYKATISVTNTAGFSHSSSLTFVIAPDEPPVVYFSSPSKVYRSPQDGNKAIVSLMDMSFSPDYDFISRRLWQYRYDSNNNDSFSDESWITFSNENKNLLSLALSEVGKYEVRLTVSEEFDQPTIDEFVTQADRRFADSYTSQPPQPLLERIVEVDNRAPEVDWSW